MSKYKNEKDQDIVRDPFGPYGGSEAEKLNYDQNDTDGSGGTDDYAWPPRTNAFARQGTYTLKDYYALPEDRRFELIDGYLIEMFAPNELHQVILTELLVQIHQCIRMHNMQCQVLPAPLDVRLDRDNRTMVQPDLLVICEPDRKRGVRIEGAPDFIVEILSKSTRSRDMVLKYRKYKNAGVREYWIVDPETRQVHVHDFEQNVPEEIHSFEESIRVRISEGKCAVDFGEISRVLW